MLRQTFENISNNDQVVLKNKIAILKASINDTIKANAADSTFKGDLKMVGIRLDEVLNKKGSIYDVLLQEGDIVEIPKKVETVQTFSGVYFPKKVVYRDGLIPEWRSENNFQLFVFPQLPECETRLGSICAG
jgi:hypothetical protein